MARLLYATVCLAAFLAPSAASDAISEVDDSAMASDDQCAEGDAECTLGLLQVRGGRRARKAYSNQTEGASRYDSCVMMGCDSGFQGGRACQCNAACIDYGNCCSDHTWKCSQHYTLHANAKAGSMSSACSGSTKDYKLDLEAKGADFFDHFTFVDIDDVHGAHQFTNHSVAVEQGVATTEGGSAQMRFGGLRGPSYAGEAWKRYATNLHTNKAWDPAVGFLAVLHYKSLPYGCGIWPSFWAMNSDKEWPGGGELDILEYANFAPNKVSFHLSGKCGLDYNRAQSCIPLGRGNEQSLDCETNYFVNKMGCWPKQRQPDGEFFAKNPGVIAAEWTEEHIIIYHIPEDKIPQDLKSNDPETAKWGEWIVAFLPLQPSCKGAVGPQELVLNMQLCGDWAGATFGQFQCAGVGPQYLTGCHKGLSQTIDCCTRYVTDTKQDGILKAQVWDIESLKVFTHQGAPGVNSGTFRRGGLPVTAVQA